MDGNSRSHPPARPTSTGSAQALKGGIGTRIAEQLTQTTTLGG